MKSLLIAILFLWVLLNPISAHGIEQAIQTSLMLFVALNLVGFFLSILGNWQNFKLLNAWRLLSIFLAQNMVQVIATWTLFALFDRSFKPNSMNGLLLFWASGWIFGVLATNLLVWFLARKQKSGSSIEQDL